MSTSDAPLYRAVREGDLAKVRKLLATGADPNVVNSQNWTCLLHACYYGKFDIVCELVHYGANLNVQLPSGWTPIYLSSQNGHREIVELLARCGADVGKPCSQGFAPLHAAARNGHGDVIETLIAFNADMEQISNIRSTPLMAAVYLKHPGAVRVFLDLNADTTKSSVHGYKVSDTDHIGIRNLLNTHKPKTVHYCCCRFLYQFNSFASCIGRRGCCTDQSNQANTRIQLLCTFRSSLSRDHIVLNTLFSIETIPCDHRRSLHCIGVVGVATVRSSLDHGLVAVFRYRFASQEDSSHRSGRQIDAQSSRFFILFHVLSLVHFAF
jgi:hypothetical protein